MRQRTGKRLVFVLALLCIFNLARGMVAADEKEPVYGGKHLSEWLKGLRSEEYATREATQSALRKVDPKELTSLIGGLKSNETTIRRKSAQVLGAIGPKAAAAMKHLTSLL